MMKAVAKVAALNAIPCEISLENTMACGIGACLCCVVETVDGNKTTCIEGPVFDTRKLK
jgi:dihydroorotate dehydrogenase electron transfer subunit